ncbi:hypothetical protein PAXINDRAFT_102218 [Paxillus involutus ATCC 200175]|uniref:Protein kinase domain-containing protein n=1 Tax=Paxillus involutus ATCC 200175 TaxID=664439 RepID=A0A0C9TR07_PAXIN|nr:hypothetical protein PAXINDRAFT_102218 [Paxillus involutus ATCC 200175]
MWKTLWNTSPKSTDLTAKPLTTMSGHEDIIWRISYLSGGKRVVSCSADKTVRIWDVEKKGEQEGTSMVHESSITALAVTKDGKRILSGGGDWRITMWDVETHERIEEWAGHIGSIWCIALSPDDRLAASSDWHGEIVIREVKKSGRIKHSIVTGKEIYSLCFSPNGEKLACGGHAHNQDYIIQVYDVDSGKLVLGPIKGHQNKIQCVLWSLDGSQLFSASDDRTIRCWDSKTGEPIGKPWTGHMGNVFSLSLSPDGTKLASSSLDQTVRFWDARSGNPIGLPLKDEGPQSAVAFSPSGEFVACGNTNVSIWRVPWWDESQKQLPAGGHLIELSSPPPAQAAYFAPIPIATPDQRSPDTARNLNHIRSNFAHDLTGYVVREGDEPITSGSFGDIYRGKLRLDGKSIDVAVKAIRTYFADDGGDAQKNKKLRRELKTWANLDHVNIIPLFGTTMNFGRFPAMVCPWLENGSLTSYLERRHDSLNPADRVSLISDAAAGLQYLHSQSIVHGDLSGSNVLIDGNGRACISDFGLSTLLTNLGGSTYATSSHAGGTLRWTAPELLDPQVPEDEDNPVDVSPTPQSDVYSFGRIMLQILTGKVPYYYYTREPQVLSAISRGMIPKRPSRALVTDRQWTFMERCWMPVDGDESRPGDEEIVQFARQELVEIEKTSL